MLYVLIVAAFLLYRLDWSLRIAPSKIKQQKDQFNLYALRDELRFAGFNGEVDIDSEAFDIVDEAITSSISGLVYLTPWQLLPYVLLGQRFPTSQRLEERKKVSSQEGTRLSEFMDRHWQIVFASAASKDPLLHKLLASVANRKEGDVAKEDAAKKEAGIYAQVARFAGASVRRPKLLAA